MPQNPAEASSKSEMTPILLILPPLTFFLLRASLSVVRVALTTLINTDGYTNAINKGFMQARTPVTINRKVTPTCVHYRAAFHGTVPPHYPHFRAICHVPRSPIIHSTGPSVSLPPTILSPGPDEYIMLGTGPSSYLFFYYVT